MRSTFDAVADGAGDSGIRLLVGVVRPPPPPPPPPPASGKDDRGMFAMTVERIVPGETPRVAGEQPVTERKERTAVAPTRGRERVYMPNVKAAMAPDVYDIVNVGFITC